MEEIMMRQLVLEGVDDGARLVTWVNDRPDLKYGCYLTLEDYEDPKKVWKVVGWDDKPMPRGSFVESHNSKLIHQKDFKRDSSGSYQKRKL